MMSVEKLRTIVYLTAESSPADGACSNDGHGHFNDLT